MKVNKKDRYLGRRNTEEIEYYTDPIMLKTRILEQLGITLPAFDKPLFQINDFLKRNQMLIAKYQR